jgi:hypothetical protein
MMTLLAIVACAIGAAAAALNKIATIRIIKTMGLSTGVLFVVKSQSQLGVRSSLCYRLFFLLPLSDCSCAG